MGVSENKRGWLTVQLERLAKKGISKADIARKLDILPQSLNNVINGNRGISDAFIDSLEKAYDIRHFELCESLADRLSLIIIDLDDSLENTANYLGLDAIELGNFTNNLIFPSKPFDFARFLEEYPEYNFEWILIGSGDRFKGDQEQDLKAVRERVYRRNHPEYYPKSEATAIRVEPDEAISGKVKGIPLIPYAAFAGYGSESFQDLVVEDYYIVKEFKDADFLIRVKGDSMTPKYNGGDVLACKKIDAVTFWQWHKVYAICTKNQGILIKRVEEYPNNPAFITLKSENPVYHPFELHEDEIISVAIVLGAIVLE